MAIMMDFFSMAFPLFIECRGSYDLPGAFYRPRWGDHSFLPRDSGKGDRAAQQHGGRGVGLDEILSTKVKWRSPDAPSTILRAPRYGWSPSPASRGRIRARSRGACAPEL